MIVAPLHPTGPELADKNRRVLAERLHWPAGAVEACEQIETEAPGWAVTWAKGGDLTWTRPGYYAQPTHWPRAGMRPFAYGATPAELRAAISDREPVVRWARQPNKPLTQVMNAPA